MFDNFQLITLGSVCKDLITPYHKNASDMDQYCSTPLLPYILIPHQNNEVLHSLNSVVELDSPLPLSDNNDQVLIIFSTIFSAQTKSKKIGILRGEVELIPGPSKHRLQSSHFICYAMTPCICMQWLIHHIRVLQYLLLFFNFLYPNPSPMKQQ